jgi:hypothetical protein
MSVPLGALSILVLSSCKASARNIDSPAHEGHCSQWEANCGQEPPVVRNLNSMTSSNGLLRHELVEKEFATIVNGR